MVIKNKRKKVKWVVGQSLPDLRSKEERNIQKKSKSKNVVHCQYLSEH